MMTGSTIWLSLPESMCIDRVGLVDQGADALNANTIDSFYDGAGAGVCVAAGGVGAGCEALSTVA